MRKELVTVLVVIEALTVLFTACTSEKQVYTDSLAITVAYSGKVATKEIPVTMPLESIQKIKPDFNAKACAVVFQQSEIPFQINDLNSDSIADELVFLAAFGPADSKEFKLAFNPKGQMTKNFRKRTQAELSIKVGGEWKDRKYIGGTFKNVTWLRVPPEHTDHSDYIRYEGPGWESDKIAYRYYLDWRNATDIFGKLTDTMVLQHVGQAGLNSYHDLSPWGMDVFKVDQSLGIGSVGMWQDNKVNMVSVTDSITCRIVLNGPVQSLVETKYYGWKVGDHKYSLTSDLSIFGGSRLTRHDLTVDNPAESFCTGIILNDSVDVYTNYEDSLSQYVYFGTWGWQSLNHDNLGLGVIVSRSDLLSITQDKFSHVLVFRPGLGNLRYYFMAAWEKEPNGIRSSADFKAYLEEIAAILSGTLLVTLR